MRSSFYDFAFGSKCFECLKLIVNVIILIKDPKINCFLVIFYLTIQSMRNFVQIQLTTEHNSINKSKIIIDIMLYGNFPGKIEINTFCIFIYFNAHSCWYSQILMLYKYFYVYKSLLKLNTEIRIINQLN